MPPALRSWVPLAIRRAAWKAQGLTRGRRNRLWGFKSGGRFVMDAVWSDHGAFTPGWTALRATHFRVCVALRALMTGLVSEGAQSPIVAVTGDRKRV